MADIDGILALVAGDQHATEHCQSNRALAYARVSTEKQEDKGLSIPAQRAEIERYAEQNGIEIVEFYEETGSAFQTDHRRAKFDQMIELAESDPSIGVILVHDYSRFSRDAYKTPQIIGRLKARDVRVISATEPAMDLDSVPGLYMQKITEAKNAAYSLEVAFHTRKGMRQNIRQRDPETGYCYKNGGQPLFGYRARHVQVGGRKNGLAAYKTLWELDDAPVCGRPRWEWARDILEMARNGASLDRIRDFLNSHGVPAPRSRYWATSTVHSMLEPHCLLQYAGYGVWNVRGKNRRWNPVQDWEIVEGAHPCIITLKEATAALEIRRQRRPMNIRERNVQARTQSSRFLLTGGLFRCSRCGANMVSHTDCNGKGRKNDYYVCGSVKYRKGLGCGPGLYIDKAAIEQDVTEGIAARVRSWADEDLFIKEANKQIAEQHSHKDDVRADAEKNLRDVETKMQHIRDAIEQGLNDVSWANDRLSKLVEEREEWQAKLDDMSEAAAVPKLDVAGLRSYFERFSELMNEACNEEKRELVRCFVSDIKVEPETRKITIVFKRLPANFVYPVGAGACFEAIYNLLAVWLVWRWRLPRKGRRWVGR